MNKIDLREGDNRESLKHIPDNSIDSVVTDPPYGLTSIAKRFGKEGAAPAKKDNNDGSFARLSGGFMAMGWDSTGIENDPEFWAEVLRVMKPGAYLVAFSSSRTYHRMTTAIEEAGFTIHPMIGWLFSTGFPKAHAADKAIDKMLGVKGAFGEPKSATHAGWIARGAMRGEEGHDGWQRPWMNDEEAVNNAARVYLPGSPEAAQWEGWAYGGQVRKPALEPICVAQKPFSEKTGAANILKWGMGAVNVDRCRVPYLNAEDQASARPQGKATAKVGALAGKSQHDGERSEFVPDNTKGRHPANLIHDGSSEVVALFPDSKGQQGAVRSDEPSGVTKDIYGKFNGRVPAPARGDSGSAARFFECYPFDGEPVFYFPKANKQDRASHLLQEGEKGHLTVKPIALMASLIRHVTPPGGTVLDPFAGTGTTGEAALREGVDCILMEAEPEYISFLKRRFNIEDDLFADLLGSSTEDSMFEDLLG